MATTKSPLDEQLNAFLQRNNGCAAWGDLINAREPRISKSVLKAAIDRMIKNGRMTIKAEKVGGKTTTLYCLPDPIPTKDNKSFLQWVDRYMVNIEGAHQQDVALGVTKSYATKPGGPVEEHLCLVKTQHIQAHAISQLIDILGDVILDELGRYSQKESDAEAEKYIDAIIKTDLAVLIKNFAKLVSPRYGDAKELVARVKEHMEQRIPVEYP